MNTHIPTEYEVETYSGSYVDVNRPQPNTIYLRDIAHALSNICRYGGHSKHFYSVAQHAVFCAERTRRQGGGRLQQIAALHHDDAEAFLGDIPRPLKPLLGAVYERLTKRMDVAIITALQLPVEREDLHAAKVKSADNWSLFVEAKHLLPSQGRHWWDGAQGAEQWGLPPRPRRIIVPDYYHEYMLSPNNARDAFLRTHARLMKGVK